MRGRSGGGEPVSRRLKVGFAGFGGGVSAGVALGGVVLLWMDGLSFPAGLAVLMGTVFTGMVLLGAGGDLAHYPKAVGCVALAGVVAAAAVFVWYRANRTAVVWAAERDAPQAPKAVGAWVVGDTVIRVRPDLVTAYALEDGRTVWTWAPPGREIVCAMSASTSGGVGLIGHADEGRDCAATSALDVSFGQVRWTHRNSPPDLSADLDMDLDAGLAGPISVALVDNVGVVSDGGGWSGLSVADGAAMWRVDAGDGCSSAHVAAETGTVVGVTRCSRGAARALVVDAADGRVRTSTELPVAGGEVEFAVLSVDPVVLWVDEWAQRGTRAVLVLDDQGGVRATIPGAGPDHELLVGAFNAYHRPLFAARPVPAAVVIDGLLIAPPVKPGDQRVTSNKGGVSVNYDGRLAAFSLTDGSRVWTSGLDDKVQGITVGGGSVWVLAVRALFRIDPADGSHDQELTTYNTNHQRPVDLQVRGDRFVVIAEDGTDRLPPVRVLKPDFVIR